ncbi:MAG TPA: YncE family protein, partial [Terriglobales bacterium]|nr:YncE family protein [Terriglobales bacterium]
MFRTRNNGKLALDKRENDNTIRLIGPKRLLSGAGGYNEFHHCVEVGLWFVELLPLERYNIMKRIATGISLVWAILSLATFIGGQAQKAPAPGQTDAGSGAPPRSNPLRVALLKWYDANRVPTAFPVGKQPYGVAFDGENIWTANNGDGTVSKVRANDGTLVGTFPAGNGPYGVTYDGANMWVSALGGTVTKLRGSDGKNLGSFPAGQFPTWMTFDGANIWVPDGVHVIAKLRARDGKNQGNFTVGNSPMAAACDGSNIWVANTGDGTVSKLRASDGTVLGTF